MSTDDEQASRQAGQQADKRAWEVAHGRYKGQACRVLGQKQRVAL
jgi:hypothetical protein